MMPSPGCEVATPAMSQRSWRRLHEQPSDRDREKSVAGDGPVPVHAVEAVSLRTRRPAWTVHPNAVWCQGEVHRTFVGDASDFTGRTSGSPQLPSHPHSVPIINHDQRERPIGSSGCPLASPPVASCPARPGVGRSEDGAKSRPPSRPTKFLAACVAGDEGARVGGPTGPLGLPEFTTRWRCRALSSIRLVTSDRTSPGRLPLHSQEGSGLAASLQTRGARQGTTGAREGHGATLRTPCSVHAALAVPLRCRSRNQQARGRRIGWFGQSARRERAACRRR